MAASSGAQRKTRGELCWTHPDGAANAKIRKPRKLREGSKTNVCLKLKGQHGAAIHLIGKKAELGEVSAIIRETGIAGVEAEFAYEDLIQQVEAGNHDLIIDGVRWIFRSVSQ